jgi:tetratricopeptide (TPR) repeat protein
VLAPFRVTAASEDEVIDAIDALSREMRSKIGESLRSVAQSDPLPNVTTSSLEALRKYTTVMNGLDRGLLSPPAAQGLLLEAVALDSTFASAYRALSIAIRNYGGDREVAAWAATAAYEHRSRLTERERLQTEAFYHAAVSGDLRGATSAYREMLERFPDDYVAATNLADREMYLGNYEAAVQALRRTPRWGQAPWTFNDTAALAGSGDLQSALAARDTADIEAPSDPYGPMVRALLLSQFGRLDDARAAMESSRAPPGLPLATELRVRATI